MNESPEGMEALASNLVDFCDGFDDFHDYCAFMCDAFACLAVENESLNPDTANGIRLYAQWLKRRVGKLKGDLAEIHQKSRRTKRDGEGADTDTAGPDQDL